MYLPFFLIHHEQECPYIFLFYLFFYKNFLDAALGRGKTSSGDAKLEAVSRLDKVGVAFSRKLADTT